MGEQRKKERGNKQEFSFFQLDNIFFWLWNRKKDCFALPPPTTRIHAYIYK